MKYWKYLPIFIWSSCLQTEGAKPSAVSKWFDLKQFISKSNEILPKNAPFEKTLQVQGTTESKKEVITDWANELAVFAQSDINRPAWRDKYQVDTLKITTEQNPVIADDTTAVHMIRHIAKDKSLKTKSLSIKTNRKYEPLVIEILNEQSHFFSHSQQHLIWDLREGYSITAQQKMLFMDATETRLKGRFLKK
jgi:hypothetical protein